MKVAHAKLGSLLLGSADPERLRAWYCAAFSPEEDESGFLNFGGFWVLIEGRSDVVQENAEPGRVILNFSVEDAREFAKHLDGIGVTWLVEVEERADGLFGTLVDPDGNYVQIIQMSEEYMAAHGG
jgi:hypothetical protein